MGVSASAISRVTGIEVTPKNFNKGNASMLPQRLVIVGLISEISEGNELFSRIGEHSRQESDAYSSRLSALLGRCIPFGLSILENDKLVA